MSEELYKKLKEEFYRCNHVKYRKYFEEWVHNVTEAQLKWWAEHWNLPYYEGFNELVIGTSWSTD